MSSTIFLISTLLVISLIYHFVLKVFSDKCRKRIERWTYFIIITGGAFLVNYYAFEGLSEIKKSEYSIWYPIGVTVLMFIFRGFYEFLFTPSNSFISTEEKSSEIKVFPAREYKKVTESDADKIAIYPRITIRDTEIEDIWCNEVKKNGSNIPNEVKELYYSKHIIFDSSDFVVINKTFGAFEGLQESFTQGTEIKFKDEKLYTEKVQVDFMNIYDDYSGGLISKHTNVYEGKDTPYNIQIIVWAKRIKK